MPAPSDEDDAGSDADVRHRAVGLAAKGLTYRAIAAALHISLGSAYRYVKAELLQSMRLRQAEVAVARELSLRRLDDVTAGLAMKVRAGNERAALAQVRGEERRARLLGLDASVRVAPMEVTVKPSRGIDLSKLSTPTILGILRDLGEPVPTVTGLPDVAADFWPENIWPETPETPVVPTRPAVSDLSDAQLAQLLAESTT